MLPSNASLCLVQTAERVSSTFMGEKTPRRPFKGSKLYREVVYVHLDEAEAIERAAEKERTSKSEIIRRCIRAFFGIED